VPSPSERRKCIKLPIARLMGPAERPGGGGASATSAAVAPAEIQILYCFVIVDLSSNEDSLEPFSAQAVIDRHYYGEQAGTRHHAQ